MRFADWMLIPTMGAALLVAFIGLRGLWNGEPVHAACCLVSAAFLVPWNLREWREIRRLEIMIEEIEALGKKDWPACEDDPCDCGPAGMPGCSGKRED